MFCALNIFKRMKLKKPCSLPLNIYHSSKLILNPQNNLLKYASLGITNDTILQYKTNVRGYQNTKHQVILDPVGRKTLAQNLVQSTPFFIQPYLQLMRIDRPIGSWLLFWPCAWSISLAADPGNFPDLHLLSLFALGSLVMRGVGCTINDMWDKDIDKKVTRTANRPLASGNIEIFDALTFLGMQMGVGCLILLQLNWYSVVLGASSLGFVVLYPIMKRWTYWPQLMLGFTFNWGAMLGWASVYGSCDWSICLPLYIAGVMWTLIYDTIYAHQDKFDDVLIGIKSTALKFGEGTHKWLTAFSATMITSLLITGVNADLHWPFYMALSAVGLHVINQILSLKINDSEDCARKFRSNRHVGMFLFFGIVASNLLKNESPKEEKSSFDESRALIGAPSS